MAPPENGFGQQNIIFFSLPKTRAEAARSNTRRDPDPDPNPKPDPDPNRKLGLQNPDQCCSLRYDAKEYSIYDAKEYSIYDA